MITVRPPEPQSLGRSQLVAVAGIHIHRVPLVLRGGRRQEPDRAAADHEDTLTRLHLSSPDRVPGRRAGLVQTSVLYIEFCST